MRRRRSRRRRSRRRRRRCGGVGRRDGWVRGMGGLASKRRRRKTQLT
jgi:hypothetical protein